jgi:hypothetical protein
MLILYAMLYFVFTGALMINGDFVHGKRAAILEGMVSKEL